MKVSVIDLKWGDIFSFSKNGSFHMVLRISTGHIEYKSYNDGKIRVVYLNRKKKIHLRNERDKQFQYKWFEKLDYN